MTAIRLRIVDVVTVAAAVLLSVMLPVSAVAQRPTTPPDPSQAANNADQLARQLPGEARGLDAGIQAAKNHLNTVDGKTKDLKKQTEDADKKTAAANDAAQKALTAANRCSTDRDKKAAEALIKDAEKQAEAASDAQSKASNLKSSLTNDVDETEQKVNTAINKVDTAVDNAMKGAKDAGLDPTRSSGVFLLQKNKADFDAHVNALKNDGDPRTNRADQGAISKLKDQGNAVKKKIDEAASGLGQDEALLNRVKEKIDDARKALANCPPKQGAMAVPQTPKEVFVTLNNTPQYNVCIASGQPTDAAISRLGLSDASVVASTPAGTMVRTTTDAATIEKAAQANGLRLCAKPEPNYCLIFTPLTPFRGHDHAAHVHSGRAPHDHDGPNPPLDWGVTPTVPTITLE